MYTYTMIAPLGTFSNAGETVLHHTCNSYDNVPYSVDFLVCGCSVMQQLVVILMLFGK